MTSQLPRPEELARDVAVEYARIPQVVAVAMAGSRTSGNHDERSDIDLYVYAHEAVPVALRREIAERRGVHVEVAVRP